VNDRYLREADGRSRRKPVISDCDPRASQLGGS
jgi:hypothetical protein